MQALSRHRKGHYCHAHMVSVQACDTFGIATMYNCSQPACLQITASQKQDDGLYVICGPLCVTPCEQHSRPTLTKLG